MHRCRRMAKHLVSSRLAVDLPRWLASDPRLRFGWRAGSAGHAELVLYVSIETPAVARQPRTDVACLFVSFIRSTVLGPPPLYSSLDNPLPLLHADGPLIDNLGLPGDRTGSIYQRPINPAPTRIESSNAPAILGVGVVFLAESLVKDG